MQTYSICTIDGNIDPGSGADAYARLFGHIAKFVGRVRRHQGVDLLDFLDLVTLAISLNQVRVFFNEYGHCVGYVIWAFPSPKVEQQLIASGLRQLAIWEWVEGIHPWILDFQVAPGSLPYVIDELHNVIFKDYDRATYFRKIKGRLVCKCAGRNHRRYPRQ